MAATESRQLGLNFTNQTLYYAVADPGHSKSIAHIGSFDFNFEINHVLLSGKKEHIAALQQVIDDLKDDFDVTTAQLAVHPKDESWVSLPKLVKDRDDERSAHIDILARDISPSDRQLYWFDLSKQDYKFLVIRDKKIAREYQKLTQPIPEVDLVSAFEISERWMSHIGNRGSFLTITCANSTLAVTSYMLGKLRAATYIQFDDIEDLPYLWVLHATHLTWLRGFHEQIYLYGEQPKNILHQINPYLDQGAEFICMDTLDKIKIECKEQTYGFDLAQAFPAIMLALEH